jgi:hypothetical protein
MKKHLTLFAFILISINLFAQAPQKMSYQAVIRNASNNLVVSSQVKMKISILQGGVNGTAVYSELHNPTTNANGLATIEIGGGSSPVGTIGGINWGNGTYFLKTETDPTNGTNYSIVGTSQLLSVPYALESKNASSAGDGIKGISQTGDTVFLNNGKKYIIPGIKDLNPSSTINNGLVGYWPFNGNANDESGNGYNGTVNGATLTSDRFGNLSKAYNFLNSYIEIPSINQLNGLTNFTLSSWVFLDQNANNGQNYILCRGWDYTNGFNLWINHSIASQIINGFNTFQKSSTQQTFLNNWKHLVVARSGNTISFYINGQLDAVHTYGGALVSNNEFFYIGVHKWIGQQPGYFPYYFRGKIDDVRIHNRALTQDEITFLANN